MRVHVVSDVHGRADALASAGRGADALICLGDLLLFLDYADYGQGIFADLFGPDATRVYVELRTAGRFDEARELSARLLAEQDQSPALLFETAIARQYAELFGVLTEPAYLTYGNVDVPRMWQTYAKPGHHVLDGGIGPLGPVHCLHELRPRQRRIIDLLGKFIAPRPPVSPFRIGGGLAEHVPRLALRLVGLQLIQLAAHAGRPEHQNI